MAGESIYFREMGDNFPFPGQAVEAACPAVAIQSQDRETGDYTDDLSYTVEEEHGLALLVQDGLAAHKMLPDIEWQTYEAVQSVMPDWLSEATRIARATVREGRNAERKLVEANLRMAHRLALTSMTHPEGRGKPWPVDKQLIVDRIPWLSPDMFHLQSPYGSVEDRNSVAYFGLVRAAREFTPGQKTYGGKLKPFDEFAAQIIQQEMVNYMLGDERPHYDASSHAVSLDALEFEGAASEEADSDEDAPMLTAEDMIANSEPEDFDSPKTSPAVMRELAAILDKALSVLPERYAHVVKARMGFYSNGAEVPFAAIAQELGVRDARVRSIFNMSIDRLRQSGYKPLLASFLEMPSPQPLLSGDGSAVKAVQAAGVSTVRLVVDA